MTMENVLKRPSTCTTQCCWDANVPLYVVKDLQRYRQRPQCDEDPRPFVSGSSDYVFAAARDARREIKQLVVHKTLARQQNGSFWRGQAVGRAETQVANTTRDVCERAAESASKRSRRKQQWRTGVILIVVVNVFFLTS